MLLVLHAKKRKSESVAECDGDSETLLSWPVSTMYIPLLSCVAEGSTFLNCITHISLAQSLLDASAYTFIYLYIHVPHRSIYESTIERYLELIHQLLERRNENESETTILLC